MVDVFCSFYQYAKYCKDFNYFAFLTLPYLKRFFYVSVSLIPPLHDFSSRIDDSHCDRIPLLPLFRQCLCDKAASGLEGILCKGMVKEALRKHG